MLEENKKFYPKIYEDSRVKIKINKKCHYEHISRILESLTKVIGMSHI